MNNVESIEIKHIRALSNGWPSNSMAEAFYYVLKYFSLNHMDLRNLSTFSKALEFVIDDYSHKRPHGTLNGLTPFEAHTGKRPEDHSFASQIEITKKIRIVMNQNHYCSGTCHLE